MPSLDDLIKDMNKSAKTEIIQYGIPEYEHCTRIPFTSPRMNYCTFGGIPIGYLIEFFGEEHGGKTTTALDIVGNYQRMENARKVIYLDVENRLDVEWATKLGVDVESLITVKPTTQSAEELFQFILDFVDTGEVGLFVMDSIPALSSEKELEKQMGEVTVGGVSAPLTVFSRKVEKLCHKHRCTGIGINQLRDKVGSMYGGTTTPGGRGWRHFCTVRMEFRQGSYIDENGKELSKSKADTPSGQVILMSMVKNSTCPPSRRTGSYTIRFDSGVDYIADLLDLAILYGIIEKKGAWFTVLDIETGEVIKDKLQGEHALHSYLEENGEILGLIDKQIMDKMSMS